MTAALVAGAGFGLGLLAIIAGLAPRRASLADALDFLTRPRPAPVLTLDAGGWAARLGRPAAALLAGLGLPGKALRADLALLGRPQERLLAEQATGAIAGLLLVPAMTGLLAVGGLSAGWQLPAGGAVVLAVAGFTVPSFVLGLLLVGACFATGFWWLHRISVMRSDPRLLTNLAGVSADGGNGARG